MAERVWASMKATDSRECRSCHHFATMALESQDRSAARKHQAAAEKGDTCIDCHKGVAHTLPAGMESEDDATPDAAALSAGGAGNRG
jgi:cytochrome c-type protein NapC